MHLIHLKKKKHQKNPVIYFLTGNKYTYIVSMVNFGNGTCTELSILDTDGNMLMSYEPAVTFSDIDMLCSVDIVVPNTVSSLNLA